MDLHAPGPTPAGAVRVATFNVFWLGAAEADRIPRTARDEEDLVTVLRLLDADALVFQEIVDVTLLESLLLRAGAPAADRHPRRYRVRDEQGRVLTTGAMRSRRSHIQK